MKNLFKAICFLLAAMLIIEAADKGMRAFLGEFDTVYQDILRHKGLGPNERSRMGETVLTILKKQTTNGASRPLPVN